MGKRVGNNGNGGKKGRSGRKPKAFTTLKKRIEAQKQEDAEYAFSLYASVMHDAEQPLALRLDCADWVANRVLGKAKERQEISGDQDHPIRVVYVNDWRGGEGVADASPP